LESRYTHTSLFFKDKIIFGVSADDVTYSISVHSGNGEFATLENSESDPSSVISMG